MKRTVKKASPLPENLIQRKETKAKNISIYLNAEALQYLDNICSLYHNAKYPYGRSQVIQDLLLRIKKGGLSLVPMFGNDNSETAKMIRRIAGIGGEKQNE